MENHLHPRYKQTKDIRPFEGIKAQETGDMLEDQTLELECRVTNSAVSSCHVIPLQEEKQVSHEIAKHATEQFRIYQGADQLILFHKNTIDPDGVMKTERVILATPNQDSSGLKHLMVRSVFRRTPKQRRCTYTPCLCSLQQHDRQEARNGKHAFGSRRAE